MNWSHVLLTRERNACRHRKIDFGTGARAAPQRESGANPFGALPHAREPPVPVASGFHDLRIDAPAVVAHEHAESARAILDFELDSPGLRMAVRVDDGLTADPV